MRKFKLAGRNVPAIRRFTASRAGTKFLGVPCGTAEYVREQAQQLVDISSKDLDSLRLIATQPAVLLLQQCINRRVGYMARVVDRGWAKEALRSFDKKVSEALASLVDIVPCSDDVVDHITSVRGFTESMGGLNIATYDSPKTDSWLVISRNILCNYADKHCRTLLPLLEQMPVTALESYRSRMEAVGNDAPEYVCLQDISTTAVSLHREQREEFARALTAQGRLKERRWLEDSSFQHSARWLRWTGGFQKYMLWDSASMKAALRLRLLLPLSAGGRNAQPPLMCNCSANLSEDPWHCLDCTHNQHLATRRHTRVVDILTGFIKGVLNWWLVTIIRPLDRVTPYRLCAHSGRAQCAQIPPVARKNNLFDPYPAKAQGAAIERPAYGWSAGLGQLPALRTPVRESPGGTTTCCKLYCQSTCNSAKYST